MSATLDGGVGVGQLAQACPPRLGSTWGCDVPTRCTHSQQSEPGRADLPLLCGRRFGWSVTSCWARRTAAPSPKRSLVPSPLASSSFPPGPVEASRQHLQKSWEGFLAHTSHCSGRKLGAHWLQRTQTANRTSHEMVTSSAVQRLLFLRIGVLPRGSLLTVTLILKLVYSG